MLERLTPAYIALLRPRAQTSAQSSSALPLSLLPLAVAAHLWVPPTMSPSPRRVRRDGDIPEEAGMGYLQHWGGHC